MTDNLFTRTVEAAKRPERTFITAPEGKTFSYSDAFGAAARFAHVLSNHGVVPGDRVAVQVEKSPEALFLYLACLRLGAIYLPLNTGYTPNEVAYFVGDAEPRIFVCSQKNREKIAAIFPADVILTLSDDGNPARWSRKPQAGPSDFPDRRSGDARPGRHSLHLRHHRPLQGRHAQPRQSVFQRRKA